MSFYFSVSTLQQFTVLNNKQVPNYDDLILTGMSVDDCASACVSEEYFQCGSFEYDYNAATCYLSHLHPDETPKLIKNQNGVDLYIRKKGITFKEIPILIILTCSIFKLEFWKA